MMEEKIYAFTLSTLSLNIGSLENIKNAIKSIGMSAKIV
jgi:hypothetical protein